MTRANTAEYAGDVSIDPQSPTGQWESEIVVGRLRKSGGVSLDAPDTRSEEHTAERQSQ